MMYFIRGEIVAINPAHVVIETNGIGYGLHISLFTFSSIQQQKQCKLFTHLHVKNEGSNVSGIELYGFYEEAEREIFLKLTSVSGIGVNTARMMLSSLNPSEIERAILNGNVALIQSIKGIGPKTAQRAILELKDRIASSSTSANGGFEITSSRGIQSEALQALIALGIAKPMAEKALSKVTGMNPNAGVEEMIKLTLKSL